jgi:hypothetical protein
MTVTTSAGTTRPAWGTSYDLNTNTATPMSVTSNTFCAGGMTLADGRWAIFGGNQPVTYEGAAVKDQPDKANPYGNTEGGDAIRVLTPCDDLSCEYEEGSADLTMTVSWFGRNCRRGYSELICRASGGTPPSRHWPMGR